MPLQRLPHRLKLGFILLACCLFLFSSVIVGWILWQGREVARRQATVSASNVLVSLGGEITRTFEMLDLALLSAARGARMPGIDTLPPNQLDALLFDGGTQAEGYGAVAITDANGLIQYSSVNRGIGLNLDDREYFQAHRATRGLGLIVSQPILSRSDGGWSVALARRLDTADGGFAGVAVGTIRL